MVTSSTIPHLRLNKHHKALAYHRVREAVASKVVYFLHIAGIDNAARSDDEVLITMLRLGLSCNPYCFGMARLSIVMRLME